MAPKSKGAKLTRAEETEREIERLKPLIEEEGIRDVGYDATNYNSDKNQWIHTLAAHLAAEPSFRDWMKNPGDVATVYLHKEWLGHVYLRGRASKYDSITLWHKNWYSAPNYGRGRAIVAEAKSIFEQAISAPGGRMQGQQMSLPGNENADRSKREQLYKLQATRQKLAQLVNSCTDTEFALVTNTKAFSSSKGGPTVSQGVLEIRDELRDLENTKSEARRMLADCELNKAGKEMLDALLQKVPARDDVGLLYQLPQENRFDVADPSSQDGGQSQGQTEAQSGLQETQSDDANVFGEDGKVDGVEIDFLQGRTLGEEPAPFHIHTPPVKKAVLEKMQTTTPISDGNLVDASELQQFDSRSAAFLKKARKQVDEDKFAIFFRELEGCVDRPDKCKTATKQDGIWITPKYWFTVMLDNVVHVRRFVDVMVTHNLIEEEDGDEPYNKLQQCLRRMWALVALAHGLWEEPALLCTIGDQLLEDLAECAIGHKDPKFETERMRRMMQVLQNSQPDEAKDSTTVKKSSTDLNKREQEHKARIYFEQIAKFFRGSLIMAVACTNPTTAGTNEDSKQAWFTALLNYNSECGHRACTEQLKVVKKVDAKYQKYSLSIAVHDSRIGFPEERSFISSNRKYAYACFSNFISGVRFHSYLTGFFHYYAHVWHPACRPFRGKQTLIDDIGLVDTRIQSQSQSQSQLSEEMEVDD